jgi:hypothetical protein
MVRIRFAPAESHANFQSRRLPERLPQPLAMNGLDLGVPARASLSVDRAAERPVPEQCNRARHQFQHFACCAGAGIPRHRYNAEGIAGLCNRPKPGPFEG